MLKDNTEIYREINRKQWWQYYIAIVKNKRQILLLNLPRQHVYLHNISFPALIILRRVDYNNTTKEEYNVFYVCVRVGTPFLHHQLWYSYSEK